MKKIFQIIKKNIVGFILGVIISVVISSYAATQLASSSVYYNNANSGGSSNTVSGALDELYSKINEKTVYSFGNPNESSIYKSVDYNDILKNHNVFISKKGNIYKICLKINESIFCYSPSEDDPFLPSTIGEKIGYQRGGGGDKLKFGYSVIDTTTNNVIFNNTVYRNTTRIISIFLDQSKNESCTLDHYYSDENSISISCSKKN